jgi:hypothetical protein
MLGQEMGYACSGGGLCLVRRWAMLGQKMGYAWSGGGLCLAGRRAGPGQQGGYSLRADGLILARRYLVRYSKLAGRETSQQIGYFWTGLQA